MSIHEMNWGEYEKDSISPEALKLCLEQLVARELDEESRKTALKLSPWINSCYLQGNMDFISSEDLWKIDFSKLMDKLKNLREENGLHNLETVNISAIKSKILFLETLGVVYGLILHDRLKTALDLLLILSENHFSHKPGINDAIDYLKKLIHLKRSVAPNLAQKMAAILDLAASMCRFMEDSGQWRNSLWHKAYGTQLVYAMIIREKELSNRLNESISNLKWGIELQLSDLRYQAQYYRWQDLSALLEEHEPRRFHRLEGFKAPLEATKDLLLGEWAVDTLVFYLKENVRGKESLGQLNEALGASKMLIEIYERG